MTAGRSQDEGKESGVSEELTEALGWALDNLRALAVGRWKPDDPAWQDMARARALLPTPPDAKPAPERERLKGWVNVYPPSCFNGPNYVIHCHPTREEADRVAAGDRIACIDLSQHHVGGGLEP